MEPMIAEVNITSDCLVSGHNLFTASAMLAISGDILLLLTGPESRQYLHLIWRMDSFGFAGRVGTWMEPPSIH